MVSSRAPRSLALALVIACGDGGGPVTGSGSSSGSSSDGEPTTTDGPGTSGDGPGGSDATTAGTTGAGAAVELEIVRYTAQPMVVDVVLTTAGPTESLTLVHPDDPGVVIAAIAIDGLATTFRVRGLKPDTLHTLTYDADGAQGPVEFITYPPLQGFVPQFEVEGGPVDPAAPYRMFDMIPFPAYDTASVFMVDAEGTTRWHLGGPSTGMPGPEGVWTAVQPRPDGQLLYLHNHTLWIRDELGVASLEIPDDMLGVTGLHHEVVELPNGNFMALSFVFEDVDYGQAGVLQTAGDQIVEFTREGELVWTWNSFDHLDPQRVTEPFDVGVVIHPVTLEETYDWTHANAIVYSEATDTLLLSLRHQDWILNIDHKTGEILWKLGRDGDFTLVGEGPWFYHMHAPQWQADGSLLLYDNGLLNPDIPSEEVHSRAVRFVLDHDAMTAERVWADDGPKIFATFAGNADRLPGGRVIVTDSFLIDGGVLYAQMRELDEEATPNQQWKLTTPANTFVYRGTAHDRLIGQPAP